MGPILVSLLLTSSLFLIKKINKAYHFLILVLSFSELLQNSKKLNILRRQKIDQFLRGKQLPQDPSLENLFLSLGWIFSMSSKPFYEEKLPITFKKRQYYPNINCGFITILLVHNVWSINYLFCEKKSEFMTHDSKDNRFPFRAICTNLFPWLDSLIVLLNQICSDPWILSSPCAFSTPPSPPQQAINNHYIVCLFFVKTLMPKSPCKNFWVLCSAGGLSYCFYSSRTSSQQLRLIIYIAFTRKTSKYILQKKNVHNCPMEI